MPDAAAWDVIYDESIPAEDFLDGCPKTIQDRFDAVLDDIASGPPLAYRGGGYWEAMGQEMTGWFEVRLDGPGREHFRLFCMLENRAPEDLANLGLARPAIAVVTGGRKRIQTKFSSAFYARVRLMGDEYRSQEPRRIAEPDPAERTIVDVQCDDEQVTVRMESGSTYSLPLFGRLLTADPDARAHWSCARDQSVIYWPRLKERRAVADFFEV
jgi:hypothetical protein